MDIKKGTCGVVILNYNSHDLTVNLANRLKTFTSINYICVVDNASKDDFKNDFVDDSIHYIKNKNNLGYNAGNNIGLKYLIYEKGCEFVFIANPDVIFDNKTIECIKERFISDSSLALISTKRYGANNTKIHQYFDFPTLRKSINSCFFLTRLGKERIINEDQNYQIDHAINGIRYVDAVPGAFFGLRSEFLVKNDFLYEGVFLYGEELFTGMDAHILGYKAAIINDSMYVHNHMRSKFSNSKMFWFDRISLRQYYKRYGILTKWQLLELDCAIRIGTIEYNMAHIIWKLISKKVKR